MVFELKPNELTSKNLAQAIGYVLAANDLFDIPWCPSPVGVLSDLADQWKLIQIGKDSQICIAETELTANDELKPLSRETALYYIRRYIEKYHNLLLEKTKSGKRPTEDQINWTFDGFDSGRLKKIRVAMETI